MRGCSAVTAGKQCDALLIELECFTGFDEDKLLAIKPTVWMKAWRELSANIWVRIQCCSCAMCGRSRKDSRLAIPGAGVRVRVICLSILPHPPGPKALNESFFAQMRCKYKTIVRSCARSFLLRGGKTPLPEENCLERRSPNPFAANTR